MFKTSEVSSTAMIVGEGIGAVDRDRVRGGRNGTNGARSSEFDR